MVSDGLIQEGAYADVVVKLGLVKLLTKTFDICEEAYVICPVQQVYATVLLTMTQTVG